MNCTFDDIHMCGYSSHIYGHALHWMIRNGTAIQKRIFNLPRIDNSGELLLRYTIEYIEYNYLSYTIYVIQIVL